MKLLCQPKTYAIGLAVTYILAAPSFETTAKTPERVGVGEASCNDVPVDEAGSCKPRYGWDCIHGSIHLRDKCDPGACS